MAQTQGSTTTRYTQDLVAPLSQILQLTQGTQRTDYVYGHERLLALEGTAQTWYGSDALGSVRQTLDATGAALTALHYDPWGTPPVFGFTGELQDGTRGLVYLRARWYQPQHGRFLSRDPWIGSEEEPQTLAYYAYVHNDPANWTDPTGRWRFGLSSSAEHTAIEERHVLIINAARLEHVHAEYPIPPTVEFPFGKKADIIHSDTGAVYEIEPIYAKARARPEALEKKDLLLQTRPVVTWAGQTYDWSNVPWHLGEAALFGVGGSLRIEGYLAGVGDLVAKATEPGVILYWIEPRPGITIPALQMELKRQGRDRRLAKPSGWSPSVPAPAIGIDPDTPWLPPIIIDIRRRAPRLPSIRAGLIPIGGGGGWCSLLQ
ncbi:RHS repeat-associated core domain-containing protein [Kallotenue papyrolyticum]|uniref:RHS repeat-associated core domain-containing protein n=1 Tax=Kallotenue papyrolyticum TaxID=1325125 RepID=UPI0013788396|nr:RHS repeat-associated core domain-containing protein [Kallotenue papyrolyticum]